MAHRLFVRASLLPFFLVSCAGFYSAWLHPKSTPTADDYPGIEDTPSFWYHSGSPRSDVDQLQDNLYRVSLDDFQVVEQNTDYSCWAACAEMVLNFLGHDTTQEEIIRKVKGKASPDKASPGTGLEIMKSLAGEWTHVHYDSGDSALMAVDLADGWPVILALDTGKDIGHAVVLTGMTISWQSTPTGSLAIVHSVDVCDPTPGVGRDHWSGEEFAHKLDGAIHMRDASKASYPGR